MSNPQPMINEFQKGKGSGVFAGANRIAVAQQLRNRLNMPSSINQRGASLCGPAAFLYCVAVRKPVEYVKYIIDLFESGKASIGALTVEPSARCKAYSPGAGAIDTADWIGLASLRDSENTILTYGAESDKAAGVTTPGTMKSWFASAGFGQLVDDTSLIGDEPLSTLLQAHHHRDNGAMTCLFIGAKILSGSHRVPKPEWKGKGKMKLSGNAFPDHWVVLNSQIYVGTQPATTLLARGANVDADESLHAEKLKLEVYTWGTERWSLPSVTVEEFLDYFYGYVAAT
jgi:hypothetical protein